MKDDRREYMRTYQRKYGHLMRERTKKSFKVHPDYRKYYSKKWRELHPVYHKEWQREIKDHYSDSISHVSHLMFSIVPMYVYNILCL